MTSLMAREENGNPPKNCVQWVSLENRSRASRNEKVRVSTLLRKENWRIHFYTVTKIWETEQRWQIHTNNKFNLVMQKQPTNHSLQKRRAQYWRLLWGPGRHMAHTNPDCLSRMLRIHRLHAGRRELIPISCPCTHAHMHIKINICLKKYQTNHYVLLSESITKTPIYHHNIIVPFFEH